MTEQFADHRQTVEVQAARLGDLRLQTVQRQALAAQIGRVQGNRHLQRMITSINDVEKPESDQLESPVRQKDFVPRSPRQVRWLGLNAQQKGQPVIQKSTSLLRGHRPDKMLQVDLAPS